MKDKVLSGNLAPDVRLAFLDYFCVVSSRWSCVNTSDLLKSLFLIIVRNFHILTRPQKEKKKLVSVYTVYHLLIHISHTRSYIYVNSNATIFQSISYITSWIIWIIIRIDLHFLLWNLTWFQVKVSAAALLHDKMPTRSLSSPPYPWARREKGSWTGMCRSVNVPQSLRTKRERTQGMSWPPWIFFTLRKKLGRRKCFVSLSFTLVAFTVLGRNVRHPAKNVFTGIL